MLRNVRVYIFEGEPIVALELQQLLEEAGASASAHSSIDEVDAAEVERLADLVIVDARQGAADAVAFVARLREAGVATVIATADSALAPLFGGAPLLEKPFLSDGVVAACEQALAAPPPSARTHEAP